MKKQLLFFLVAFYCLSYNVVVAQDGIAAFNEPTFNESKSGNNFGQYDNSVNLLTGQINFTEPLAGIEPKNGLNFTYSLQYNSTGVREEQSKNTYETVLSEVGTGWSVTDARIIVDHKGTGSRYDDKFYLKQTGQLSELIRTSSWSENKDVHFEVLNQPNVRCTFKVAGSYFKLEMPNGITQYFGDTDETKAHLIKWENWIGESTQITNQGRQVDTWMLSRIRHKLGDQISLHYVKAEETVGDGTLKYTRWIYLNHIIGPKGDQIDLHYADLPGSKDNYDPKVEYEEDLDGPRTYTGSDKDAYQEKYNMKYLAGITKTDEFGNIEKEITLGYLGSSRKKLETISVEDKYGFSKRYKKFEYDPTYTGFIKKVLLNDGKTINYRITNKNMYADDFGTNNVFSETGPDEQSLILDGTNYSIKLFKNNSSKAVSAEYIGFDGKWQKKIIGPVGYSFGNLKDDAEIVLQDERCAIMLRHSSSNSYRRLTLLKPNPFVRRDVQVYKKTIYTNPGDSGEPAVPTLIGGDGFIAVGNYKVRAGDNDAIEIFVDLKNSTGWQKELISLPAGSYSYGGTNNYIISHNEDGEEINDEVYGDVIRFHYLDGGEWNTTILPKDITPNTGSLSYWHASNSFAVVFTGGNEYIFSWDSWYQNFTRQDLSDQTFQDEPFFAIVDNSSIQMRESANTFLPKGLSLFYNGVNWNNGRRYYTSEIHDHPFLGGNTYHAGIYEDNISRFNKKEYVQMEVFSRNTEQYYDYLFDSELENPNDPNDPYSSKHQWEVVGLGNRYLIAQLNDPIEKEVRSMFTLENYAQMPSGYSGRFLELDLFSFLKSKYPDLKEIVGINSKSYDHILSIEFERNNGTKDFETWVGNSIQDQTTVNSGGIDGGGLNTLRDGDKLIYILRDKGNLIDGSTDLGSSYTIVDRVTFSDGANSYSQLYDYNENDIVLAPNNLALNFKNVTKSVVNSDDDGENGFIRYTHDLDNGLNYGAVLSSEIFGQSDVDNAIAANSTSFTTSQINLENEQSNLLGYHIYPSEVTSTSVKDGFSNSTVTYNNERGLPTETVVSYYDASGAEHEKKTLITYAYEEYSAMETELLLSPIAEKAVYVDDVLVDKQVTTYAEYGDEWASHKQYVWTGKGDGTFDFSSTPNSTNWKLVSQVTSRNDNLTAVETKDDRNNYSASIINEDNLLIASFSEARLNQVFADDFSTGFDYWNLNNSSGSDSFIYSQGIGSTEGNTGGSLTNTGFKLADNKSYYIDFQFRASDNLWFSLSPKTDGSNEYFSVDLNAGGQSVRIGSNTKWTDYEFEKEISEEWWSSIRIKVDAKNDLVKLWVNKVLIAEYQEVSFGDSYFSFLSVPQNHGKYPNYQFDNFRIYPSTAYAKSYSYNEDNQIISELSSDNDVITHQLNRYGVKASSTIETDQKIAGTAAASRANHITARGASLKTSIRGEVLFRDNFDTNISNKWNIADGTSTVTNWNFENGHLNITSDDSGSGGLDALYYTLPEPITSGRVGVEFNFSTASKNNNWNIGLAFGDIDYSPTSSSNAIAYSAITGNSKWRYHMPSVNWTSLTEELEANRSYRMKVVVDMDEKRVSYFLDGHLLAHANFKTNRSEVQKISLFNYARTPDLDVDIDNFVIYTNPLHSIEYFDAFGKKSQSVTEDGNRQLFVSENKYDEYGRHLLTTKTTRVDRELGFVDGFISGYASDGRLSGLVESINNDYYAYNAVIKETSPLNRTITTGNMGENYNVFSSDYLNELYYNTSDIVLGDEINGARANYYGAKSINADGAISEKITNSIGQTLVERKGMVPVQYVNDAGQVVTEEKALTTKYVYDAKGRVKSVYPPAYFLPAPAEEDDLTTNLPAEQCVTNSQESKSILLFAGDGVSSGKTLNLSMDVQYTKFKGIVSGDPVPTLYDVSIVQNGIEISGKIVTKDGNYANYVIDAVLQNNKPVYLKLNESASSRTSCVKNIQATLTGYSNTKPESLVQSFDYDHWGNLVQKTTPDEGIVKHLYDDDGKLLFSQNQKDAQKGKLLYYEYDADDRIVETGLVDGNWEIFDYRNDVAGVNLNFQLKPKLINGGAYHYDAETIHASYQLGDETTDGTVRFTASESITLTDGFHAVAGSDFKATVKGLGAKQWKKRISYVEEGEFTNSRDQVETVSYNEDADEAAEVVEESTYDERGLLLSHKTTAEAWDDGEHTVNYEYNDLGQLIAEHYDASVTVTYAYDLAGNLIKIGKPGDADFYAAYTYGVNGELVEEILSNGDITSSYTFNEPGWIKEIHHVSADKEFTETLNYSDDGNGGSGYYTGLIKSATYTHAGTGAPSDYTYTYEYDDAMQLTSAQSSDLTGANVSLTYDANRNIRQLIRGNSTLNYSYNKGSNQLNNVNGPVEEYSYDAIGGITKSPGIDAFEYDDFHNKTSQIRRNVGGKQGITKFQYNVASERIAKSDSYDGNTYKTEYIRGANDYPVKEIYTDATGAKHVVYYVYGINGIVASFTDNASDGVTYPLKDHLGSTRLVINSTESPSWYDYMPFGRILHDSNPQTAFASLKYKYTGQEFDDEIGLYNYRARFYDTETGRFLGTDPQGQFASPYVGIGNNPIMLVDPNGEFAWGPLLYNLGVGFFQSLAANAGESFEDAANGNGTFSQNFRNRIKYGGWNAGFSYNTGSGFQYNAANGYGGLTQGTAQGASIFTGFSQYTIQEDSYWYYPDSYSSPGYVPSYDDPNVMVYAPGVGSEHAEFITPDPYNIYVAQSSGGNPITPWEVGWEWLTGTGPRHRDFTNGDYFTEMLRQHDHIAGVRNQIANGGALEGRAPYSLGGVQGVGKYLKDYSTLATGGATGNIAVTYLGSYVLTWQGTLDSNVANVVFTVTNSSTIQSATRPPVLGYTDFWQSTVGPWLNQQLSSGPMSPTTQTFRWTETIPIR